MIIALIILAVLVGVCFGIGGFLFFTACGHHKEIHWLDEAEITRTPYGQFYPHVKASYEWLAANGAQDLYTKSFDGIKLHATWVPAEMQGVRCCLSTDITAVSILTMALP